MSKYTVLSIDGGSIRGIIPGTIPAETEIRIQLEKKNKNKRISDYFDLMAGTSTAVDNATQKI